MTASTWFYIVMTGLRATGCGRNRERTAPVFARQLGRVEELPEDAPARAQ